MKAMAVIPARYASTRLPGKPLADICGKPLIQHVWENVSRVRGLDAVIVAVDDERVASRVRAFGGRVCMTSPDCQSGSDRVREVAAQFDADIYLNVQGDEPLLEPEAMEKLLAVFEQDKDVRVATLCSRISAEEAISPNQVKVVLDHAGNALYFSRAALPYVRDQGDTADFFGHIGIYAYRADVLRNFASLPASSLEKAEKLEQLRLLQAGVPIRVLEVPKMGAGVDTPEDLQRVRAVISARRRLQALESLGHIRLVITDVDGVLTDGGLYYGAEGECLKRFHARDGLGINMLQKAGLRLAVISGRDSPALRRRLKDLDIDIAVFGQLNKRAALASIMQSLSVSAKETVFIGDDIPDMQVSGLCAVFATVADAPDYVKTAADLVLNTAGGQGAFRELVDLILQDRHLNGELL